MRTFQLQDMDRSSKRRQSCCSGSGYLGTPGKEPMKVYLSIYRGGDYIRPGLLVIEDNSKGRSTSQLTRRINHWNSWPWCPLRFRLPDFFLANSLVVSGESSWLWQLPWLANWSW